MKESCGGYILNDDVTVNHQNPLGNNRVNTTAKLSTFKDVDYSGCNKSVTNQNLHIRSIASCGFA